MLEYMHRHFGYTDFYISAIITKLVCIQIKSNTNFYNANDNWADQYF